MGEVFREDHAERAVSQLIGTFGHAWSERVERTPDADGVIHLDKED